MANRHSWVWTVRNVKIFQVNEEHVKDVSHDIGSPSELSILSVGYREAMHGESSHRAIGESQQDKLIDIPTSTKKMAYSRNQSDVRSEEKIPSDEEWVNAWFPGQLTMHWK